MADPSARVVAVLGPHRAGTSLTASIVNALGVPLSSDLMPATDDNPAGYFESLEIVDAQNGVLRALGRLWNTSSAAVPFPPQWWQSRRVRPYRRTLTQIVERELSRNGGLWGFKDPRTSQLLPLWKEIFAELGVRAQYVLAIRDPRAVAKSLAARDGMSVAQGEQLWHEHVVDAITHAGSDLCATVDYDRWFSDGEKQLKELSKALALPMENARETLERMVVAQYRRQSSEGEFALPYVEKFYRDLLAKQAAYVA